jgi:hypothetical protein
MEFVLQYRSETTGDPYVDCQRLQPGDVIDYRPDGWQWSELELTNPDWRLFRIPGISDAESGSLLTEEPGDRITNRMLQRRAFFIDLSVMPLSDAVQAYINDDSRTIPIIDIPLASARPFVQPRVPLSDPNVIG